MKRSLDQDLLVKKQALPVNGYNGFVVDGPEVAVARSLEGFYEKYVESRKPVKIIAPQLVPIDIGQFRLDRIVQALPEAENGLLQVERKHGLGFGLGKKRQEMRFGQIVEKLASGDDSYYLTTQYEKHEYAETAASAAVSAANESEASDSPGTPEEGEIFDHHDDLEIHSGGDKSEDEDNEGGGFGDAVPYDGSESDDSIDLDNLRDDFDELDLGLEKDQDEDEEYVVPEHKLTQDEVDARISTLLQAPLTELYKKKEFPLVPEIFGPLIPQQINLWMGASRSSPKTAPDFTSPSKELLGRYVPKGNSSGLHHDHADNLYVLVQGKKRFTLYSPQDAEKLRTVGEIKRIFPNGLIDYKVNERARFWRPMRADGAMISEWAWWMLEKGDFSTYLKEQLEGMVDDEEPAVEGESDLDPPSFSTVPPVLAHLDEVPEESRQSLEEYANANFPGFLDLKKLEVWLEPGEMLYLPTGWFHEVTSLAEDGAESGAHVALNWWFVPPTGPRENPYPDGYWKEDFQKTLAGIRYQREQAV